MEYVIHIKELAQKDIIDITKWYDEQAEGLGNRFMSYLNDTIKKLETHPLAFGFADIDIRKVKLAKFPYLIFCEVKGHDVYIHGVIHAKRKPSYYKKRFRN